MVIDLADAVVLYGNYPALAGATLQVQRGVLTRRDWIVPWHRIQAVTLRRGPLQRRLGLATLCIDTAGVSRGYSQPHIHDLDEGDAVSLARLVLARVEEARQAAPPPSAPHIV